MNEHNMTPDELNKALFINLVMSMTAAAMQQLGKLVNPMNGKTETNLEAAQQTIDVIEMLAAKTNGNLDKDESRYLQQTLTQLRINYVETAKNPPSPAPEPETK